MKEALKKWFRQLMRKGVTVELEEQYTYPHSKDFVLPDEAVIKTAIVTYFAKEGETVEFLEEGEGVTFLLNGEEKYTAYLKLEMGRYNHGYHVRCREVVEDV